MKSNFLLVGLLGLLTLLFFSVTPQSSGAILDLIRGSATTHPVFFLAPETGAGEAQSQPVAKAQTQTQSQTSQTQTQTQTQTYYLGFPMQRSWVFKSQGPLIAQPQTDQTAVYCVTKAGVVHKVSQKDGKQLWKHSVADTVEEAFLIADGVLYVGTQRGLVYAFNAEDGKEKWFLKADNDSFLTAPRIDQRNIYFAGLNGSLIAIDRASGKQAWRFQAQGKCHTSPWPAGSLVFLGCDDRQLYAVDSAAGFVRWKFDASAPIFSSPVAVGTDVFFGTEDTYFYCLNIEDGRQRWRYKASGAIRGTPMPYKNIKNGKTEDIFLASFDNFLYDLKIHNGSRKWLVPCGSRVYNRMVLDRALIFLAPFGSTIFGFDPHTGQQVGEFDAKTRIRSSPNTANDRLFVGLNDGRLLCLTRQPPPPPGEEGLPQTSTQTQTETAPAEVPGDLHPETTQTQTQQQQ